MRNTKRLETIALAACLIGMVCGCRIADRKPVSSTAGAGDTTGGILPNTFPESSMPGEPFAGTPVRGKFAPVYFAYDSSTISDSERTTIERVALHLRANPEDRLVVEGHGDERGSNEYNLALGERRALAVRAYLVELGVAALRIQTLSYGEEQPADAGHGEDAWRQNRRAEFLLFERMGSPRPEAAATEDDPNAYEWPVMREWLTRRITVAEAERMYTVSEEALGPKPVLFGFMLPRWLELKAKMRAGDELWLFRTPDEAWQMLCGREGIVLIRNGRSIDGVITLMN
jgi:peptidoglycan-associated lipoprotein